MDRRTEYPAGVPCWVDTAREDPDAILDFYGGLFGWQFENGSPEGAPSYYMASIDGAAVAGIGGMPGPDSQPMWNQYVCVQDAGATAAKATEAGGNVIIEPTEVGPAGWLASFKDPEGAWCSVWQPGQMIGSEAVNDPGTWVSSELASNDVDGAKAFYGSVFGWETAPLGDGTMFTLAGYGDHLEELRRGYAEQVAEYEVPDGFVDMVAYLMPAADGQGPSNWNVTFSVADADASAERVLELGGQVLVEPFDAPWVRMAAVCDPDGATFTISQFVPPEPAA